ncbi:MAG: glycoside hydrolase [Sphaerochaetaceae bacterium]|nr:glycoside hydrolase [Sphaerochaetaceae bacterium]
MIKRAPASLTYVHRENTPKGELNFSGESATLRIRSLFQSIYEVRYDFTAYPVQPDIEEASAILYDSSFQSTPQPFTVREDGENVIAEDGDVTLTVDTITGTLSMDRDGIRIHGGAIGTSDTVVPRYPIRVHGAPPRHVQGQFNFPLEEGDRFFGLGDKGGDPDRRGRRFLLNSRDALGYRGQINDPLYKSIPFIIKWNHISGTWVGIAIMASDVSHADFGVESPYFYSFGLRNGPYRYILITGTSYAQILDGYTRLTGRPAFPPAFTFGFLGSSMDYVEPADAQQRVDAYFRTIEEKKIPCEGIYLSSGYYKAQNGHRHTFIWNREKFPDPDSFISNIRDRGYHVACNIKPGILVDHPRYQQFAQEGNLICDADGLPYSEFYWGLNASLWDFSSPEATRRWKDELEDFLLKVNVDGIWNDNNEYEIEDSSVPAYPYRSTMALRMAQASYERLMEREPDRRPWVITRSGGIGIQRYARTWSGDNRSDWDSLRVNLLMGSSMGLSGLPYFGHDIGGFFGEQPDALQFLFWCQSAVFQPRFVIHSWNPHGEPTELWSYPELFESYLALVHQHYEFLPYTYAEAYRAHTSGIPLQRLLCLEYPEDHELCSTDSAYQYGDAILVLPIVTEGVDKVQQHLPKDTFWYDPDQEKLISGGGVFTSTVSDRRARYLVKAPSAVIRSGERYSQFNGWVEHPVLDIYPPSQQNKGEGSVYSSEIFEDDGESILTHHNYRVIRVRLIRVEKDQYTLELRRTDGGMWVPPSTDRMLTLQIPDGFAFEDEKRTAVIPYAGEFTDISIDIHGSYRV